MRLHRPNVPLEVRVLVAQRQLRESFGHTVDRNLGEAAEIYLDRLLGLLAIHMDPTLFAPLELDHDPALCNRKFSKRTGQYLPAANDPRFLVYRTKPAHDEKTRVKGDGAQLSDLALLRKFKRIEKRKREGKRGRFG